MEIKESDRFAWFNRGKILASAGLWEESLKCFDRAIEIEPNYHEAWCEKGELLEQHNLIEEAEYCFDRALGVFCEDLEETLINDLEFFSTPEDDCPNGYYNQACFHAIFGNVERAIDYLTQAIAIDCQKYCKLALQDADFGSIVEDVRFQSALATAMKNASCV